MKNRLSPLLLLALALVSAPAFAQEGPRPGGDGAGRLSDMVKRLDANSDGKVSKEEAVEAGKKEAEERFSKLDTNADGTADEAELRAMVEKMRDSGQRRGQDGEGMRRPGGEGGPPGGPEGGFRRPPEGQSPGGPEGRGRPEGQGGPSGPGGMGFRGMGNPLEMIKNADTNKDNALDKDEFRAMRNKEADENFARMDQNSDLKITEDEFRQMAERMRAMMGGDRGGMRRPGGPEGQGMRRPGGEGGGEGGFRRPPSQEGEKPAPKPEGEKPAEPARGV